MRVLVDTNVFIWCDQQSNTVPPDLMTVLRDTRSQIFVSVASIWEIAIKRATGKLAFAAPIVQSAERMGFEVLKITPEHAEHAGGLPRHHGDPFDRMLVAQAMLEGLVLGTTDRAMSRCGVPLLGRP